MKSFLSSEFNKYITATDRLNSMLLTSAKRVKELEAKNEQLEKQLKEANEVIKTYSRIDVVVNTGYELVDINEYTKEYLNKYKVKE